MGHFNAKCSYKNKNNEKYSSHKGCRKGKTKKKRKIFRQKKNLYTNQENISSDESDSEKEEILFMGL